MLTTPVLLDTRPSGITRHEALQERREQLLATARSTRYYYERLQGKAEASEDPRVARLARSIVWWSNDSAARQAKRAKAVLDRGILASIEATKAQAFTGIDQLKYVDDRFSGQVHHIARILGENGIADIVGGNIEQRVTDLNQAHPLEVPDLSHVVAAQALAGFLGMHHTFRHVTASNQ